MFRRTWQKAMIAMARSPKIKEFMQTSRATSFLAEKYIAGQTSSDSVQRARELMKEYSIRSSLFYMGEYIDRTDLVEENVWSIMEVVSNLRKAEIDIHVSVDPTQIGYQISPELAGAKALLIAEAIRASVGQKGGIDCLMLDMEDAPLNDPTIAIHNRLQKAGYLVALTLQAYLRRTMDDMQMQVARGSRVRLVKGAFAEGSELAFQTQDEIKDNFRKLISLMLSDEAKRTGFYPIIATHDTRLHDYSIETARRNGWKPGEYEFEMLLGVRENVARNLSSQGERVRLYLPFGRDWWPHAVRRIGENPRNALLLALSLIR